jgi:hypothetical protein
VWCDNKLTDFHETRACSSAICKDLPKFHEIRACSSAICKDSPNFTKFAPALRRFVKTHRNFTKFAPARRRFVKTHRISRKADKRFRTQTDGRGLHIRCSLHSADCTLLLTLKTEGYKQDLPLRHRIPLSITYANSLKIILRTAKVIGLGRE